MFRQAAGGISFIVLIGYVLAAAGGLAAAPREPEFVYDIYLVDDTLVFWLDITPVLTEPKMADLLSGLEIYIGLDAKLERPRRLAFAKKIADCRAGIVIARDLTEDTYRLTLANPEVKEFEFENQLLLSDFLADSLVFRVIPVDDIDEQGNVRLNLEIVSKSYSGKAKGEMPGLRSDTADTGQEEDFFESLFSLFLDTIGFGKTSHRVISPTFRIDQLPTYEF